jgi:ribosomal protein S16
MENTSRRDGRPVEEVGCIIPFRKESHFEVKIQIEMVKLWC